jgi:hypothetical protein
MTVILFFPYLSAVGGYSSAIMGVTTTGPLALGLTYWSVLHFVPTLVELAAWFSIGIFVILLSIVSWKISKISFKDPLSDLVIAMLACVIVIYLSVRIVAEQYFIWALPFIVILCAGKQIKMTSYYFLSSIAFIYSILHCLLPFFLLAVSPWIGNILVGMLNILNFPGREIFLVALGILFSFLVLVVLLELLFGRRRLLEAITSSIIKPLHRVWQRIKSLNYLFAF